MLANFNTIAAKNGHLDALRWLLVNGAQSLVNIPDRFGITPLYIACAETTPRFDVAATLILYGGMASEGGNIPHALHSHEVLVAVPRPASNKN